MWRSRLGRSWSCSRGGRSSFAARRFTDRCGCYYDLHRRGFHDRHCHFGLGLNRDRSLLFDPRLCRFSWFLDCCGGCGRYGLRRNGNCGRRTRHGLRRDKTRRWLGCIHRCHRRSTRCNRRRPSHAARRTRWHGRRRSHGLAWRRCRCCGSSGTRRNLRPGGLLRDRLQHVPRFGDVRQVDLGLELFRLEARTAAAGAAGLSVVRVILLDALRLIHFDGAGVRFLFRDPNLDQQVENHFAFDLEFPRQVVNSNLLQHSALFPPYCPVRPLTRS
jgi:hypothetical protein